MTAKAPAPEKVEAADEQAKKRDPHGKAPAEESHREEPTGAPNSDRHQTETAVKKASS